MSKAKRLINIVRNGGSWIFVAKVLISLAAVVFAASISVTSSTYQAEIGSYTQFPTGLIATDKGFAPALVGSGATGTGTSCSTPIVFAALPGTANNAITMGHWVYDVQINSTTTATPSAKYNVTLTLPTAFPPLCIQNAASPANGQAIDCKFDIGTTTLPASPYSFKVTVQ